MISKKFVIEDSHPKTKFNTIQVTDSRIDMKRK